LRWHVSAAMDDRIPDFHQLTSLAGRELILPKEARFYPKGDVPKWRVERLKKQGVASLVRSI
jgi:putative restriction endonuclease